MQLVKNSTYDREKNWSFVLLQDIFTDQKAFHKLMGLLIWIPSSPRLISKYLLMSWSRDRVC